MNVKDVVTSRWFCLAAVAGAVLAFALNLQRGHEEKLAEAAATSLNLAVAAEHHAAATFQKTDLVLHRLVDEFSPEDEDKWLSSKNIANHLRMLQSNHPELESLHIVKADGSVFYTLLDAGGGAPPLSFGAEAYFAAHRDHADHGLSVSLPAQGHPDFGRRLVLSRRLNHPDGSFAGIVVANLGLSYFERFFHSLNPGRNASFTLLDRNRLILAHVPASANWHGKILTGGQLESLLRTSPRGGSYAGVSQDGMARVFAFRQVGERPFYVDVGVAKQDFLVEWRRNALIEGAVVLVLVAGVLLLSYARWWHPKVAQEEKKYSSTLPARQLIEASPDPWVIVTPDGVIGDANSAAEQITGVPGSQLMGSDFYAYFSDPGQAREACRKAFAEGAVRDFPLLVRHVDGRAAEVLCTIASFRNEAGDVEGAYAVVSDVMERRRAERLLKFENHILEIVCGNASLTTTLEILCRGKKVLDDASLLAIENQALEIVCGNASLSAILGLLCLGIEEILPESTCAVLLVEEEGRYLRHAVAPGLASGYRQAVGRIAIDPGADSCGVAAYHGRQVVCADIAHDPLWANGKELARSHGLAACTATPIFSETDDLLGVFAVYYRTPCQPPLFDLEAASRAAHLARMAILCKRADQALLQLHEALEQSVGAGSEAQLAGIALLRKHAEDRLEQLRKSVEPRILQDIAEMTAR